MKRRDKNMFYLPLNKCLISYKSIPFIHKRGEREDVIINKGKDINRNICRL